MKKQRLYTVEVTATVVVVAEDVNGAHAVARDNLRAMVDNTPPDEMTLHVGAEITRETVLPQHWPATYIPYGETNNRRICDILREQEND